MDEEKETNKFMEEQWDKLSPQMKEAIDESRWYQKVETIGGRDNLNEEQIAKLRIAVLLLFLGGIHPLDFFTKIKEELEIEEEKAISVMDHLNDQIIMKVINYAKDRRAPELLKEKEDDLTDSEKEELDLFLTKYKKNKMQKIAPDEAVLLMDKFDSKPKVVQDFLVNNELVEKIANIGKKLNLSEENLSAIEDEIILYLLFDKEIKEIEESLSKKTKLEAISLKELIKLIEQDLLNPINSKKDQMVKDFKDNLGKNSLMKDLPELNIE